MDESLKARCKPLDRHPSAEDNLIQIDGHDQGFGRGTTIRLTREYPPLRRKDDAGELPQIGDVVRGRCTTAALDVVVVTPLMKALMNLTNVEQLRS